MNRLSKTDLVTVSFRKNPKIQTFAVITLKVNKMAFP